MEIQGPVEAIPTRLYTFTTLVLQISVHNDNEIDSQQLPYINVPNEGLTVLV